jgi:hypothetical protein
MYSLDFAEEIDEAFYYNHGKPTLDEIAAADALRQKAQERQSNSNSNNNTNTAASAEFKSDGGGGVLDNFNSIDRMSDNLDGDLEDIPGLMESMSMAMHPEGRTPASRNNKNNNNKDSIGGNSRFGVRKIGSASGERGGGGVRSDTAGTRTYSVILLFFLLFVFLMSLSLSLGLLLPACTL